MRQLSFSLKAQVPATFPRDETIEVATQDESMNVVLSIADGTLMLQDSQTVVASLDPLKSLGASAFGPLRFRPIGANGEKGDWQPLVNVGAAAGGERNALPRARRRALYAGGNEPLLAGFCFGGPAISAEHTCSRRLCRIGAECVASQRQGTVRQATRQSIGDPSGNGARVAGIEGAIFELTMNE